MLPIRILVKPLAHVGELAGLILYWCLSGLAYGAGSNMPWEAPLQSILDSVQGPVAKIIAVIVIIVTGLSLAFGDTSGGFRRLIQIVFGLHLWLPGIAFWLVGHALAVRGARADPQFVPVLARHLKHRVLLDA